MIKSIFRLWMLLAVLALASCSDNDDNPAVPDESEQLADYTIMWYGHGGGNLDMSLLENMMQFYKADEESYKRVSICAQYKYSSLKNMQALYEQYTALLGQYFEPGTPDYEEAQKELDIFKAFTEGYLESAKSFLLPVEIENLPYATALFPYMQCVRFLWDYLSGDKYWKCQYPDHNFVRANNQLRLLLTFRLCIHT